MRLSFYVVYFVCLAILGIGVVAGVSIGVYEFFDKEYTSDDVLYQCDIPVEDLTLQFEVCKANGVPLSECKSPKDNCTRITYDNLEDLRS